mgnify:CR=1 FL=1
MLIGRYIPNLVPKLFSLDRDFIAEIAPVTIKTRKGEQVIAIDETPFQLDIEKIPGLKPAFGKDGTVTAANASSISDGGAALIVTTRAEADKRGLRVIAEIKGHALMVHAGGDNHADMPKPLGGGGDRMACGVI